MFTVPVESDHRNTEILHLFPADLGDSACSSEIVQAISAAVRA